MKTNDLIEGLQILGNYVDDNSYHWLYRGECVVYVKPGAVGLAHQEMLQALGWESLVESSAAEAWSACDHEIGS